jgi:glycosyltransferase involved in cell wall biosynthesis
MPPQVSIIVPVYNREQFIVECIESVSQQSFRDFELIIVDDGSTDDSRGIAESTLKQCGLAGAVISIRTVDQISRETQAWRARGLTIACSTVMTSGAWYRSCSESSEHVSATFCHLGFPVRTNASAIYTKYRPCS